MDTVMPHVAHCKHCAQPIGSTTGEYWTHTAGSQRGMHRCGPEGGLPYGYDAAPEGQECSFACLGSLR